MPEDYSNMVKHINFNSMDDDEQTNFRKLVANCIKHDSWRYSLFCDSNTVYYSKAEEEANKFFQKKSLPFDQLERKF